MLNDDKGESESAGDKRKSSRPAIQIYRPGMLKRGQDITILKRDDPPESPHGSTERLRGSNNGQSFTSNRKKPSRFGDSRRGNRQDSRSGYNSTASLYNPRESGGYLETRRRGGFRQNNFERMSDRASMRAEDRPRRKRNDSYNSTQSEMVARPAESIAPSEAPSDQSFDFSFETLPEFDWGAEVEREYNERQQKEQERLKKEQERAQQLISRLTILDDQDKRTPGILRVKVGSSSGRTVRESEEGPSSGEITPTNEEKPPRVRTRMPRGTYKPPNMRGTRVDTRDRREEPWSDGLARSEQLCAEMNVVLSGKVDEGKCERILELSRGLCHVYRPFLAHNVVHVFTNKLENVLFREAFYKPFQRIRSASNGPSSDGIRRRLIDLIHSGILFYKEVIGEYGEVLGVSMEAAIDKDMHNCVWNESPANHSATTKAARRSLCRLLICVGDLCRYRSMVTGCEDYGESARFYSGGAGLWPSLGHVYHQLAVCAYYSMLYRSARRTRMLSLAVLSNTRQERVLDEIFYCIRALSCEHPYVPTRERLAMRLESARTKGEQYEALLDKELGPIMVEENNRDDGQREIWVAVDSDKQSEEDASADTIQLLKEMETSKLFRRTVSYTIYVASLLIGKIGMERFRSASVRLLYQLHALLFSRTCPLSPFQVLQIVAIFIYAVDVNTTTKSSSDEYSVHQNVALQTLLSILSLLLQMIDENLDSIEAALRGERPLPAQVHRVLPATVLLCEWVSRPSVFEMGPVHSCSIPLLPLPLWTPLARVANRFSSLEDQLSCEQADSDARGFVLPEHSALLSFLSFPSSPKCRWTMSGRVGEEPDDVILLHLRCRSILSLADFLNGARPIPFVFDDSTGQFVCEEVREGVPEGVPERRPRLRSAVPSTIVRPVYVVPDTNVYVDFPEEVQKIIDSGKFELLVSTVVMDELFGLTQGRHHVVDDPSHASYVTNQAKVSIGWLKEKARQKKGRMWTLTSKGQKTAFAIHNEEGDPNRLNDDRIVDSCLLFVDSLPVSDPPSSPLVLLTGDRGMKIKANSRNLPTRSIQWFTNWASIS